eukprot:364904-Chlamydomonas_euryale.AAC.27
MLILVYADDLALLADSPDDLTVLLGMVDAVALKYGLCIKAAKTEVMVVGRPTTLPTFKLSGNELLVTDNFKYLGSLLADDGSVSRDGYLKRLCICRISSVSRRMGQPQAEQQEKNGRVPRICVAHFLVRLQNVDMDRGSDGQDRGHSF